MARLLYIAARPSCHAEVGVGGEREKKRKAPVLNRSLRSDDTGAAFPLSTYRPPLLVPDRHRYVARPEPHVIVVPPQSQHQKYKKRRNRGGASSRARPHHVQQCPAAGTRRSKSAPERNAAPEKIKNAGQGPTSTDRCTEAVTLPATSQTI